MARLPGSPRRLRFACDLRNVLAREVYFTGHYEPQETARSRRSLAAGGVFVDVGAHWGYFSLVAAARLGASGRIVAVEADPRLYPTLARNFALNGLAHATAVQAAAADRPGVLTLRGFRMADVNWGTSRLVGDDAEPDAHDRFPVPARPIDALLDELHIGAVDLLKMDIEGAEALALAGMEAGLRAGRYRRVLIELHPDAIVEHGTSPSALVARFIEAGYRGWTIDHDAATFRKAAYGRLPEPESSLRPFDPSEPLDAWPHQLWPAPGVAPFWNGGEST